MKKLFFTIMLFLPLTALAQSEWEAVPTQNKVEEARKAAEEAKAAAKAAKKAAKEAARAEKEARKQAAKATRQLMQHNRLRASRLPQPSLCRHAMHLTPTAKIISI